MSKIRPNSLAIIRRNGKVLAIKGEDKVKSDTFYRLIGGGIEFGELSLEALKREIREELDSTTINERFIFHTCLVCKKHIQPKEIQS